MNVTSSPSRKCDFLFCTVIANIWNKVQPHPHHAEAVPVAAGSLLMYWLWQKKLEDTHGAQKIGDTKSSPDIISW